eukprot:15415571-Alexandrium_andersonii.AAC.1
MTVQSLRQDRAARAPSTAWPPPAPPSPRHRRSARLRPRCLCRAVAGARGSARSQLQARQWGAPIAGAA